MVITDDDYVSAALGVCRQRHQQQQQQQGQQQWLRQRAITRENLSGPSRFAPSFAGDAPPQTQTSQNESSQPKTCDCSTVNLALALLLMAAELASSGSSRSSHVVAAHPR